MNTKRQTIWLVSMLSLMVVLSAYYLFTDQTGQDQLVSQGAGLDGADAVDATEVNQGGLIGQGDAADHHDMLADSDAADAAIAGEQSAAAGGETASKSKDQQVLDQVRQQSAAVSGSDYFASRQMQKQDDYSRESDRLLKIITNSKENTDALGKAYEDMRALEETQVKMTNLEELLMKDYQNAVVLEEDGKFNVVVQSDQLEKSQAVSIADTVLKELNATPDQVVIHYVQ